VIHDQSGRDRRSRQNGFEIINVLSTSEGIRLSAAVERKGHPQLKQDACGPAGIASSGVLTLITTTYRPLSRWETCSSISPILRRAWSTSGSAPELGKPLVIGSTGFSAEQMGEIGKYVQKVPCVLSPNMSIGVNLCFKVLAEIAAIIGEDYDMEIVEAHHRMKKDAPSGTAVKMAQVIARAVNRNLDEVGVYARKGMIGERTKKEIGIQTLRAGTSWASTPCCSRARASASRSRTGRTAATRSPPARSAPRSGSWAGSRVFTTCRTCWPEVKRNTATSIFDRKEHNVSTMKLFIAACLLVVLRSRRTPFLPTRPGTASTAINWSGRRPRIW